MRSLTKLQSISHRELKALESIAVIAHPDCSSRAAFLREVLKDHSDTFAIYATHGSSFGGFDREMIESLPKSVRYICSHGERMIGTE
jgi:hypothetical protein